MIRVLDLKAIKLILKATKNKDELHEILDPFLCS